MRVLKIIQANPEVFNIDPDKNYTEQEAIRVVASMNCPGNDIQKENFEIRQTHTAICNLIDLGFINTSIELATQLISRAEKSQNYKIALDLCDRLIPFFYNERNLSAVNMYKTLYHKYAMILVNEHESKLLFGRTILDNIPFLSIGKNELASLSTAINKKLPFDSLWYHYYQYQCKSLILEDGGQEKNYLEAIHYFEHLPVQHNLFVRIFSNKLIRYYKEKNEFEKARIIIEKLRHLPNSDF